MLKGKSDVIKTKPVLKAGKVSYKSVEAKAHSAFAANKKRYSGYKAF